MKDNKKEIPNLKKELKALKSDLDRAVTASHEAAGDLIPRLSRLSAWVHLSYPVSVYILPRQTEILSPSFKNVTG